MKIYPSNLNHIRFTKPTNEEIQQEYNFPCSITVLNQALSTAEVFYYDEEGNEFPQGRFNIPSDYLFQKALLKTDTAPTTKGLYPLSETGIYTNLGGINAEAGKLNFASFDGITWSKVEVELAPISEISENILNVIKEENINGLYYFDKTKITPNTFLDTDSGNLNSNSSFWTSDFIDAKGYDLFKSSQPFSFVVFYDKNKKYINGIAQAGQTQINMPSGAKYFRFSNNSSVDDNQVKVGLGDAWIYPFENKTVSIFSENIVYFKIKAFHNAENYNSIQNLIDSIADASYNKRYIVYVPAGEWFECDLHAKEFVEIVGQDIDETIIYCDGNSTKITPENYYFQDYKNTALNAIPQQFKHCIFSRNNLKISNLTIKVNDAKYCAHLDHIDSKDVVFQNVKFKAIGNNVNYNVGIGMTAGQKIELQGCIFETDLVADKRAVLFHNTNNQLSNCHLTIRDSFFVNCHYLMLDELGSEQGDVCELLNCQSTLSTPNIIVMVDMNVDGKTFWINGSGMPEPNPANVPYSIKLNAIGTYIEYIGYKPFTGFSGNPRPLFKFRGKSDNIF